MLIIGIAVWAFWLGPWLADWADTVTSAGTVNGFEAFILNNLNLIIALSIIGGAYLYLRFGGPQ